LGDIPVGLIRTLFWDSDPLARLIGFADNFFWQRKRIAFSIELANSLVNFFVGMARTTFSLSIITVFPRTAFPFGIAVPRVGPISHDRGDKMERRERTLESV
jgi:hypothetical protein